MDTGTDSLRAFLTRHELPDGFRRLIDEHYAPLADWLSQREGRTSTLVVGINGAQGTGKTTLARYLELDLSHRGLSAVVLSIDDFYLTRAERRALAEQHHPLLATRGVPGTHDVSLLGKTIAMLQKLAPGTACTLPRFDKARDDRAPANTWRRVLGPVDVILFEGWCVGSAPQPLAQLEQPANRLERTEDPGGVWRRFVNTKLSSDYAAIFSQIDVLVFLQAPDFDSIYRWRLEQEQKLSRSAGHSAEGIMDARQVARFIQHYERLTRANLGRLPAAADAVLTLDVGHDCVAHRFR